MCFSQRRNTTRRRWTRFGNAIWENDVWLSVIQPLHHSVWCSPWRSSWLHQNRLVNVDSCHGKWWAGKRQLYTLPYCVCVCFLLLFFLFCFVVLIFLYEFCTTPGVYARVKPPSHAANIKAAQNKEWQNTETRQTKNSVRAPTEIPIEQLQEI